MNNRILYCISLIAGCFCWVFVSGQSPAEPTAPPRLYLDHFSVTNGFSSNNVTCVYRDKRGFLWVGTTKGLNEFDGREVKVFSHDRNNPNSIVNNYINSITEDSFGNIWLGTRGGVSMLNPFNEFAENYRHNSEDRFSLNANGNNTVYIDKVGKIWIGNEAGLSYFDPLTKQFYDVPLFNDSLSEPPFTLITTMREDREGRFWIGTYSGLILYDRETQRAKRLNAGLEANRGEIPITSIFEDHAGQLWVGIWGQGLCLLDPETQKLISLKWDNRKALPGTTNIVTSIAESSPKTGRHILWIGTVSGMMKIELPPDSLISNTQTLSAALTESFRNPPFISSNISNSTQADSTLINCLYFDSQDILWIGSPSGLSEYLSQNQLFSILPVIHGSTTNIRIDTLGGRKRIYVTAWYGNGLTILDENLKPVKTYKRFPPDAKQMNNGQITDALRTPDGTLWVATFNGLYSYSEETRKYTSYLHDSTNSNSLTSNHIIALGSDKNGNLWISTYRHGLDRLNLKTKRFVHFQHQENNPISLCDNLVWNIRENDRGEMEFCTNNGLSIYNESNDRLTNYVEKDDDLNSLQGHVVSEVITDQAGILWIATNEGLNEYNPKTGNFSLYAHEEGLKNEEIRGMAMDRSNRLWLVSENSIAVFDPVRKTFINYDSRNGLPASDLTGAIISDGQGEFIAGSNNRLIRFNPSDFQASKAAVPVYITSIAIDGVQQAYSHPINQLKEVELNYPEHSFSCTFTAPDFEFGNGVNYAYRLDGLDTEWHESGTRNFVDYGNLAPGKYLFHVRASNIPGNWNRSEASLLFVIHPPFWSTWWFRTAMLLALALSIFGIFEFRINSIRKKEKLKTEINKQMADMRLKVLRTRMNPHFMFNALNSIQECIYTGKTKSAYTYLSKFSRLLRLILERSEHAFITISEAIEILELYLDLESLRFEQHFNYQIHTNDVETDFLKIPPMLIQPFVENAIWHGLLHKEGEKVLKINFEADEDSIIITIEDNGIGRDAARNRKIKTIGEQQSLGMHLVSEQLKTVSQINRREAGFKIEDLFIQNPEKNGAPVPAGTRVTITLPAGSSLE